MPNAKTIYWLLISIALISASRYLHHKQLETLHVKSVALGFENRLYRDRVDRQADAALSEMFKTSHDVETYRFLVDRFRNEAFDSIEIYKEDKIDSLLRLVSKIGPLDSLITGHYNSTLELYQDIFTQLYDLLYSHRRQQADSIVLKLIVGAVKQNPPYCSIIMSPMDCYYLHNGIEVYKNGKLLPIQSIPFKYSGNTKDLKVLSNTGIRSENR